MYKPFLLTAAIFGGLAVMLGAFGAHGLKALATPEMVEAFKTGVTYQMYHVFGLFAIGIIYEKYSSSLLVCAGVMFIIGVILFSGSLYFMTYLKVMQIESLQWVGIVTPVGGVFMIIGWILLLFGLVKAR